MSALQELQNYTFVSKYARWVEDKNRRETWKEAVERVKGMMHSKYPEAKEEIDWAYDIMYKKKVLGSQRALQFGGDPILKRHSKIYNCTASYCDRLRFFQECFWLLLCGSGTGFSVQKHHVSKLPNLEHDIPDNNEGIKYIIEDSIEGWADALGVLLSSYFSKPIDEFKMYKNSYVVFDYSQIRPKGTSLSSGVGKAPGFEPLQNGLEKVRLLLDRCISNGQKKLRPIDAYDIVMHSSDAVLSGGVRRSASLALFSPDDEEMTKAKTGNWYIDNPQRARSNNSALLLKDETTLEQFQSLMESVKEFGEPGFIWSDSTEMVFNPCVEISLWPVNEKTGESGWQGCNLSTINCSSIEDEEDFYERCKAAAIIGTLQAGFTKLEYLGKNSEEIFEREALLGVSMTGIMEKHDLILTEQVLKKGSKIAVDTNKEMAKKINIRQAARVTCLKPEGTSSSMLGTSSGIHPHHAKRYIRHVQANVLEAPYQHFKKYNPQACYKSAWSANNTDEIIKFPIEVPDGSKLKNQLPAVELLEIVKQTQKNWVQNGKNKALCTKDYLCHNVSNTVTVKPDEWDDVTKYIYNNRKYFAGIRDPYQIVIKYMRRGFGTILNKDEVAELEQHIIKNNLSQSYIGMKEVYSDIFTQFEQNKEYKYVETHDELKKIYKNNTIDLFKFNAISSSGNINQCKKSFFDLYYETS